MGEGVVGVVTYSRRDCVHYTSSGLDCHAGISTDSMLDDLGRMPCVEIRGLTGKLHCAELKMPAPKPGSVPGAMSKAFEALANRLCPKCSEPIAGEMEFNDNMLAMPCRHVIRSAK